MHLSHSPVLLIDRFAEPPGVQLTALEALQISLRLDLTRMFNVRNGMTVAQFLDGAPTPGDYGLPDTRAFSAQSATDLRRWELVLTRAIALYEPRLIQVRVKVAPDAAHSTSARVAIAALAQLHGRLCQFHFDTTL